MNGRFPTALHIMTLLCSEARLVPSTFLAGSLNINAVLVRKELSSLIKDNLVLSLEGKNGGYRLARPATDVTLAEIYQTVKPEAILGQVKNHPNPACAVGKQINEHLQELYVEVDLALMQKLGKITLAEFCNNFQ